MTSQKQESVWDVTESPSIKTYTLPNFRDLPQIQENKKDKGEPPTPKHCFTNT